MANDLQNNNNKKLKKKYKIRTKTDKKLNPIEN